MLLLVLYKYTPSPDTPAIMVMYRNAIRSMAFVAETSRINNILTTVYFPLLSNMQCSMSYVILITYPWSAHFSKDFYPLCLLWNSFNQQPTRNKNKWWLVENGSGDRNDFVCLWVTLKVFKQQVLKLKHDLSVRTYRTGIQEYLASFKRTLCQHCYCSVQTWCLFISTSISIGYCYE